MSVIYSTWARHCKCIFSFNRLQFHFEVGIFITPILQIRKGEPRDVKQLDQIHEASKVPEIGLYTQAFGIPAIDPS